MVAKNSTNNFESVDKDLADFLLLLLIFGVLNQVNIESL
jgi:hypothetical protein